MDAVLWPAYNGPGGALVAVIAMADGSDPTRVKQTLDRFAINWRMEKS